MQRCEFHSNVECAKIGRYFIRPGYNARQGRRMSDRPAAGVLTLDVELKGSTAIVRCHGRLVSGAQSVLHSEVSRLIVAHKQIVLDLTDLTRMDSMGVGTLVRLYVSAKSAGCTLELVNLGTQIRHMLGTTNLLAVFSVVGEDRIKMG